MSRVLHSFIDFSGEPYTVQQLVSEEERDIIRSVVVSTSGLEAVQRSSQVNDSFRDRVELARSALRTIATLCKNYSVNRDFLLISGKTYGHCLKIYKQLGKEVELEFFIFLEGATFQSFFNKGDDQLNKLTRAVTHLFYSMPIAIRMEVVPDADGRSEWCCYEYLLKTVKNLLSMKLDNINEHFLKESRGS